MRLFLAVSSPPKPANLAERWWTGQRPPRECYCGKDCLWRNDPLESS